MSAVYVLDVRLYHMGRGDCIGWALSDNLLYNGGHNGPNQHSTHKLSSGPTVELIGLVKGFSL